ncbi:MAG: helix-turn-helix domain-containing protein [gamma proteobacterium symbiont of Taylorina sp.]|nr:helix-turn-helix domain-containing protein [gamma proteobacterium symbiont of Taylorina sp.]
MANKLVPKKFPTSPFIENTKDLGAFIRAQRTQHGLVIDEAAKMLGVSVDLLSGVENGNRNVGIDKVLQILSGLGLKMSIFTKKQAHYAVLPAIETYNLKQT